MASFSFDFWSREIRLFLGLVLCCLGCGFGSARFLIAIDAIVPAPDEGIYRIGIAKVDITPDFPVRLNGFGGRRLESEGVGQRIWAKCLAIQPGETSPAILLMTVDSLGIRLPMVDRVCLALSKEFKIPRENIAVTFTHSHCTPKVDGACDTIFSSPIPEKHQTHITRYTGELENSLIQVGRQALENREPSRLSWSVGKVGFAVNRRTRGGPVDHSLPVLFVESLQGKIRAVYTTYACHCVTLSYNQIHGDWAGSAQLAIERTFPGAIGMVSIGCGSDSNPSSGVTGDKVNVADQQGSEIAREIKRLYAGKRKTISGRPVARLKKIPLGLEPAPSKKALSELARQKSPAGYNAQWQLKQLENGKTSPDSIDYPVQTFRFGTDMAMVFLAGEVCVDYSIRLRNELDSTKLWIHGYSNDFCAYIPSERLLREGGYGGGAEIVYFALPAKMKSGLEQQIISEVKGQLPQDWKTTPGTQGVPPKDPGEALKSFQIDPNLEIRLVTSEPQIKDPVAIDFGLEGQVWVVEMPDYARNVDAEFPGSGKVKFLRDFDGDGFFEKATLFLDGLRFPTDIKVWKNGVLICDAPHVLFAEDTTGDGKADRVEKWLSGFATHNPHARVNSLRCGLDGWLYGSCGLFGGEVETRSKKRVDIRGRDFRWNPETDTLEAVAGRSQQGRVRDDWNRWFGCDNGTLLRYYPIEDRYLKRNPLVVSPPTQVSPLVGPNPAQLFPAGDLVLFKLSGQPGRPTSACGLGIYRDQTLGKDFYGNTFTCEPVNQLIHRRVIESKGQTLIAKRASNELKSEFLTSTDRWFRPVQVRTGPDGALWVVDMYRYVIEHPRWIPEQTRNRLNVFAGSDRGRIYRIQKKRTLTNKLPDLENASDAEWIRLSLSENGTARDLAIQKLIWDNRRDLALRIVEQAKTSPSPAVRAQGLALAFLFDVQDYPILEPMFHDPDPLVQRLAIRFSENRLSDPTIQKGLIDKLDDENQMVREQAFWSLGQSESQQVARAMIQRWPASAREPNLRCAVLTSIQNSNAKWWRDQIFSPRLAEVSNIFLETELLSAVMVGLKFPEWRTHFANISKFDSETMLSDPRLQCLVASLPDAEIPPLSSDDFLLFEQVIKKALARLKSEDVQDVVEVTNLLATITRLPGTDDSVFQELLELIRPQVPLQKQKAILKTVATSYYENGVLIKMLRRNSPAMQSVAIDAWLERDSTRNWLLKECRRNPMVVAWFSDEQKNRWQNLAKGSPKKEISKLLDLPGSPKRTQVLKSFQKATLEVGDTSRGLAVFSKQCANCHRFQARGVGIGPDLDSLVNRNRESLLVAILDPSRDVDSRFRSVLVGLSDGRSLSGMIVDESATSIKLRTGAESEVSILRKNIEQLQTNPQSFMPNDFEKVIDQNSMSDLITYLMSPVARPKKLSGNKPRMINPDSANAGLIVLPANAAEIYGKDITFETPLQNIGYWHGRSDFVRWKFNVTTPGAYEVRFHYSCANGSAGNRVDTLVDDQKLTFEVPATGGWGDYKNLSAGKVDLKGPRHQLQVSPNGAVSGAVMDLKSVTLHLIPQKE